MTNPRWPIELFGQDLNLAVPNRIQSVGGYRVDVPSRVKLPFPIDNTFANVVIVTGASGSVPAGTQIVIIERVAPTATTINLPPISQQQNVQLTIIDWSSGVLGGGADHVITIDGDSTETIMRELTYAIVSNSVQLAHVTLIPLSDVSGWGIS